MQVRLHFQTFGFKRSCGSAASSRVGEFAQNAFADLLGRFNVSDQHPED